LNPCWDYAPISKDKQNSKSIIFHILKGFSEVGRNVTQLFFSFEYASSISSFIDRICFSLSSSCKSSRPSIFFLYISEYIIEISFFSSLNYSLFVFPLPYASIISLFISFILISL
jgi:hypothetical protein